MPRYTDFEEIQNIKIMMKNQGDLVKLRSFKYMIKVLFVCHGRIYWVWWNAYKSNIFCASCSILPMIYQYFGRVRLAIIIPNEKINKMDELKKRIYDEGNIICWLGIIISLTWDFWRKGVLLESMDGCTWSILGRLNLPDYRRWP